MTRAIKKLKKTLPSLLTAYALATTPAYADEPVTEQQTQNDESKPTLVAKLQSEVFANNAGVLSDSKALVLLGDDIKFRYFTRDRFFLAYDGTPTNVWLQSWGVAKDGLRLEGQLRMLNDKPSAWVGVGYDGKVKDFFGLVEGHVSLHPSPIAELNTVVAYTPSLPKGKLKLEYQGLHWFNKGTPFSGTGRVRVGYSPVKELTFGAGTEFAYGIDQQPTINVGGFVRVNK